MEEEVKSTDTIDRKTRLATRIELSDLNGLDHLKDEERRTILHMANYYKDGLIAQTTDMQDNRVNQGIKDQA